MNIGFTLPVFLYVNASILFIALFVIVVVIPVLFVIAFVFADRILPALGNKHLSGEDAEKLVLAFSFSLLLSLAQIILGIVIWVLLVGEIFIIGILIFAGAVLVLQGVLTLISIFFHKSAKWVLGVLSFFAVFIITMNLMILFRYSADIKTIVFTNGLLLNFMTLFVFILFNHNKLLYVNIKHFNHVVRVVIFLGLIGALAQSVLLFVVIAPTAYTENTYYVMCNLIIMLGLLSILKKLTKFDKVLFLLTTIWATVYAVLFWLPIYSEEFGRSVDSVSVIAVFGWLLVVVLLLFLILRILPSLRISRLWHRNQLPN